MSIPVAANTTCDIYNPSDPGYPGNGTGNGTPSIQGASIFFEADYENGLWAGDESQAPEVMAKYTHWALIDAAYVIQDGYTPAGEYLDTLASSCWVPSANGGTRFMIVFVERINPGGSGGCKKLYLRRTTPTWPTANL